MAKSKYPYNRSIIISIIFSLIAFFIAAPSQSKTLDLPENLQKSGTITYCSDITSPPLEYYKPGKNAPSGSDIDFGNEIAKRLGLRAKWNNVKFNGIIPALLAGHCDAIISQLFNKPKRREVIDFVDYMYSSEAILVNHGNPKNIHNLDDLSGLKVAVENGTTVRSILAKKNKELQKDGKKKINIVVLPSDTSALMQLQIGQVSAYGTTIETAAYYIKNTNKVFQVAGKPFHRILTGIGLRKDEGKLKKAIQNALDSMMQDGTYTKILNKWGLEKEHLNK